MLHKLTATLLTLEALLTGMNTTILYYFCPIALRTLRHDWLILSTLLTLSLLLRHYQQVELVNHLYSQAIIPSKKDWHDVRYLRNQAVHAIGRVPDDATIQTLLEKAYRCAAHYYNHSEPFCWPVNGLRQRTDYEKLEVENQKLQLELEWARQQEHQVSAARAMLEDRVKTLQKQFEAQLEVRNHHSLSEADDRDLRQLSLELEDARHALHLKEEELKTEQASIRLTATHYERLQNELQQVRYRLDTAQKQQYEDYATAYHNALKSEHRDLIKSLKQHAQDLTQLHTIAQALEQAINADQRTLQRQRQKANDLQHRYEAECKAALARYGRSETLETLQNRQLALELELDALQCYASYERDLQQTYQQRQQELKQVQQAILVEQQKLTFKPSFQPPADDLVRAIFAKIADRERQLNQRQQDLEAQHHLVKNLRHKLRQTLEELVDLYGLAAQNHVELPNIPYEVQAALDHFDIRP